MIVSQLGTLTLAHKYNHSNRLQTCRSANQNQFTFCPIKNRKRVSNRAIFLCVFFFIHVDQYWPQSINGQSVLHWHHRERVSHKLTWDNLHIMDLLRFVFFFLFSNNSTFYSHEELCCEGISILYQSSKAVFASNDRVIGNCLIPSINWLITSIRANNYMGLWDLIF